MNRALICLFVHRTIMKTDGYSKQLDCLLLLFIVYHSVTNILTARYFRMNFNNGVEVRVSYLHTQRSHFVLFLKTIRSGLGTVSRRCGTRENKANDFC